MRMKDIMTKVVESIAPDRTTAEAYQRMRAEGIRHLVVVEGHRVVGMVSDRDVAPRPPEEAKVADVMITPVVSTDPSCPVRDAANLLRGCAIDCLPVMEGGRLVGIVTTTDLLELLGNGSERPLHQPRRRILANRGPVKAVKGRAKAKR